MKERLQLLSERFGIWAGVIFELCLNGSVEIFYQLLGKGRYELGEIVVVDILVVHENFVL
jgi:hypothetical protein